MNILAKTSMIVLVGPTAIGKTALSLELCDEFNCEIVSMDSMQVYRYMDIGTAKVTNDERALVPHHLIDIVDPDQDYDVGQYIEDADKAIADIISRGKIPLVTGGTGLYLQGLMYGVFSDIPHFLEIRKRLQSRLEQEGCLKLHEELTVCDRISAERIHCNDSHRLIRALEIFKGTGVAWSDHLKKHKDNRSKRYKKTIQIGLTTDRDILYKRINKRTKMMFDAGLETEVRGLLNMGYRADLKSMRSIGYSHMTNYIKGNWTKDKMMDLLARDTRRYAKRQYTWFNKVEDLIWKDVSKEDEIKKTLLKFLKT